MTLRETIQLRDQLCDGDKNSTSRNVNVSREFFTVEMAQNLSDEIAMHFEDTAGLISAELDARG